MAELKREPAKLSAENTFGVVTVDNDHHPEYSTISIQANDRPGLLSAVTAVFRDLGLLVRKVRVT